jgi:DNA-binding HxlR family transcriptional regulator
MTIESTNLTDTSPDQLMTIKEQQMSTRIAIMEHEEKCDINIATTLHVLVGKWKLPLLYEMVGATRRFNELRRALPGISQKMLTQQLRELEDDGLVCRKVIPDIPPKVEYSLTTYGQTLGPLFDVMFEWGANHRAKQQNSPIK